MMQSCPVPDVDRALSPYIRSREEALKIRRTLSKYLTASLRPVNSATQTQHLNHGIPHGLGAVGTNPPGLKGTRGAYLDAIRSHKAAQTKLERLQSSLAELQERHMTETPINDKSQENDVFQSYIALLRQRRRSAELEIVTKSLEKLLNVNPIQGSREPRDRIKDLIGEQPSLPAERLESLSVREENDTSILRLKKEVIDARTSMELSKAARSEVHDASREVPSLEVQVHALARARDEMVVWVQNELAKMEEESGFLEDASPVKRPATTPQVQDLALSESQIQACYTRYTASRSTAITYHQSLQQQQASLPKRGTDATHDPADTSSDSEKPRSSIRTAQLLPYLPHLAQIHTNERHLLTDAVYLQTQISSGDNDMSDSLARLADESHLLPSGSRGVEPWGRAAVELEERNTQTINERLQTSILEINKITAIVNLLSLQSEVLDSN